MRQGMPRWITRTLIAILVSLLVQAQPAGAMVGAPTDSQAHPNVGALIAQVNGQQVLACTGTLIAPAVFLTAGHCGAILQVLGATATWVTFDTALRSGPPISCGLADCAVTVPPADLIPAAVTTDPAFDLNAYLSGSDTPDLAVALLATPAPAAIHPALLPPRDALQLLAGLSLQGNFLTSVGYGLLSETGSDPAYPAISAEGLFDGQRRAAAFPLAAINRSYLAIGQTDATYLSSHDSGGPLFLGPTSVLAGLTSEGGSLCPTAACSSIYRLDTPAARHFLGRYVALP